MRFTVARQRLTLRNQIVCQGVSQCVSVFSIGWERVGGRGAVRWECGGVGRGAAVVIGGR